MREKVAKAMSMALFDETYIDAAIAIIRGDVLEEAARVAERASRHPVGAGDGGTYVTGTAIDAAAAIRALKDKQ